MEGPADVTKGEGFWRWATQDWRPSLPGLHWETLFSYSVPLKTLVTSEAAAVKNEQKGLLQPELFSRFPENQVVRTRNHLVQMHQADYIPSAFGNSALRCSGILGSEAVSPRDLPEFHWRVLLYFFFNRCSPARGCPPAPPPDFFTSVRHQLIKMLVTLVIWLVLPECLGSQPFLHSFFIPVLPGHLAKALRTCWEGCSISDCSLWGLYSSNVWVPHMLNRSCR